MGKSITGGTRSYLRGRVGADVYSIGRDAKGKKQQVVRSLAETVANPQTQAQMRGRMIMSTVMQALSQLKPIVDHSFDNVVGKQPNISEFIQRNYALIKADVAAHAASGNVFGLVKYGEKGAKQGAYIIADGQAALPAALTLGQSTGVITIALTSSTMTGAGLRAALNLSEEEYFTLVGIDNAGKAWYERFRINPELADATAISSSNIADVFAVEGNATATLAVAGNSITITLSAVAACCAVIISKKTASGYIHNEAVLGAGTGLSFNANQALPTYPVGSADYLNGGDIFGMNESFNGGGEPTPSPSPTPSGDPVLTALTYGGASVLNTTDSEAYDSSSQFAGSVDNYPSSGELALYVGSTKVLVISQASFSGVMSSKVFGDITLRLDGVTKQTCGSIYNGQD